ncbi:MAG: NTP transferase domain-containing protein [Atribacterota bacterium]|nr:NTP transferase domain-containing protein [Atribacterota bacterium]MDD4896534.1 NTP transferase domain-containing protein [Atribacterota bacterium]MDD5636338.1 NTP transferase domain-containing protein [Atribacterota bacterium]
MNALILAGKKDIGKLENNNKLTNKALLMINEIPMIEYVVNALLESKLVDDIVVVGPEYDLVPFIEKKVKKILDSTDSIIENIKIGLDYFNDDDNILLLTSDIPLITGEIIDRFIKKCEQYNALFYYPIITKETILKKYPETVRSYALLNEGTFCGGNMAIFSRPLFDKNKELLNELYQNRKDVKKYVRLLGIKFLIKYLLKTLTIKEIEEKASLIAGYPVKSITIDDPEVMIDLDKLSDYELILQTINQKNPTTSS